MCISILFPPHPYVALRSKLNPQWPVHPSSPKLMQVICNFRVFCRDTFCFLILLIFYSQAKLASLGCWLKVKYQYWSKNELKYMKCCHINQSIAAVICFTLRPFDWSGGNTQTNMLGVAFFPTIPYHFFLNTT